jgi:hypothetical protein
MAQTNRKGVLWGKGEELGFTAAWVAICEEHSQIAEDTNGKRIRTYGVMDFCECHMGTCTPSYASDPCGECGRAPAVR